MIDEQLDIIERAAKENGRKLRYRLMEEEEVRRVRTSVELEAEAREARERIRQEFEKLRNAVEFREREIRGYQEAIQQEHRIRVEAQLKVEALESELLRAQQR